MKKQKIMPLIIRFSLIAILLSAWELMVRNGNLKAFYISYPTEIFKDLIDFIYSGDLWKHASVTLYEAFVGLFWGSIIGITVGVLFSQFKILGKTFTPIINAISGIPQLALAPVYILWFGIGLQSKFFLAGLSVFFNVFFSTYGGIADMEKKIIEAANLLESNQFRILFKVVIPSCMPRIISGIRAGVSSSLIGAIVGEYIGAAAGFGWMIAYATSYFNIKRVMSCILILLIVGMFLNYALDKIEKLLLKWHSKTSLTIGI